jgi:hypothetical protein
MANDIYGFDAEYKGVGILTAKNMKLIVSGGGSTTDKVGEYLVQNVNVMYQQPVQILRELSSANAYYHTMPPQGSITIGRIVGKRPITALLGPAASGVWTCPKQGETTDGRLITLTTFKTTGPKYTMYGCIVESFSSTTDANSSFVQENVSIRFGKMSIERV